MYGSELISRKFDLYQTPAISEHYFHCLFCSGCNDLLWLLILNVNIRALFSRIYDVAVIMKTIWRLNFENVLHRIDHHSDSVTFICFQRQFFPLFMFFLHLLKWFSSCVATKWSSLYFVFTSNNCRPQTNLIVLNHQKKTKCHHTLHQILDLTSSVSMYEKVKCKVYCAQWPSRWEAKKIST